MTSTPLRSGPFASGKWSGDLRVLAVLGAVGVGIMAFFTYAAAEVYESVLERDDLAYLDTPVLQVMIGLRTPFRDAVVTAFTTIGGPIITPILVAATVIWLSLRRKSWLPILLMVIASAGSLTMTLVGKDYVGRVRPAHELAIPPYEFSPAFPSGHALNSFIVAGVLAYLIALHTERRRTWILCAIGAGLYALLMGLSRVYLGHHWLTDVITGWLLGAAWLALLITVHRIGLTVRRRRTPCPHRAGPIGAAP